MTNRYVNEILALVFFVAAASVVFAQENTVSVQATAGSRAMSGEESIGVETGNPALAHRDPRYRLCPSDVIALAFPMTPEFDQAVNIQPDGFASLAGAGNVRLEGLTTEQAAAAIRKAYGKILHDPIITLELKDFNKPYFVVSGQVNRPGKYDLRGFTSATQAVAVAGGFNDSAKHSQVLIFRRVDNDWTEVKLVNLKRILQGHDVQEDTEIRTGDMIFVPQNLISKVKKFIPSTGVGTYYQLYR
jgi:polysaccharide biosynthesis/export protein